MKRTTLQLMDFFSKTRDFEELDADSKRALEMMNTERKAAVAHLESLRETQNKDRKKCLEAMGLTDQEVKDWALPPLEKGEMEERLNQSAWFYGVYGGFTDGVKGDFDSFIYMRLLLRGESVDAVIGRAPLKNPDRLAF